MPVLPDAIGCLHYLRVNVVYAVTSGADMIRIRRVYEKPSRSEGYRVLVDRLWPRGMKKSELAFDAWEKDLAPSNDLRRSFGHKPGRWPQFRSDYLKELRSGPAREKLRSIAERARKRNVTLLYSARDEEHNNAVVLRELLQRKIGRDETGERSS